MKFRGHLAIAANAMSATFTPSEVLLPNTSYVFNVATCAYICVARRVHRRSGEHRFWQLTVFTTGTTAVTTAPTVVGINPPNGTTPSVPVKCNSRR